MFLASSNISNWTVRNGLLKCCALFIFGGIVDTPLTQASEESAYVLLQHKHTIDGFEGQEYPGAIATAGGHMLSLPARKYPYHNGQRQKKLWLKTGEVRILVSGRSFLREHKAVLDRAIPKIVDEGYGAITVETKYASGTATLRSCRHSIADHKHAYFYVPQGTYTLTISVDKGSSSEEAFDVEADVYSGTRTQIGVTRRKGANAVSRRMGISSFNRWVMEDQKIGYPSGHDTACLL